MGFLDEAVIVARSGDGGSGCISFRREKYVPKGGPDGGDGGKGGSIIAKATRSLHTLTDYGSRKSFKGKNGGPGKGKKQSGKNAPDLIIRVPLGTVIQDLDTGETLADMVDDGQEEVLIPGGKGGKGNQHFATPTNRTPRIAQPGLPGQERRLKLSIKFLADIGLVGLPNAGKSTLLSRLSTARPKVGSYPFTTIIPNLGVMTLDDDRSFIIADIPGLIQGASLGRGLGHRFLKHIERTTLLLHILDITYQPKKEILEDYHTLREEMNAYNPELAKKPHLVLINKIDIYGPGQRDLKMLSAALRESDVEAMQISALTGMGLDELKKAIMEKWSGLRDHGLRSRAGGSGISSLGDVEKEG